MATEKQIAANILNAQKSTGPKTEEGKNKSRLNAKRDGLTLRRFPELTHLCSPEMAQAF